MVTDQHYIGYSGSVNGLRFDGVSVLDQNIVKLEETSLDHPQLPPDRIYNQNQIQIQNQNGVVLSSTEEESPEDFDFSDGVLKYINQVLMEERNCVFQESSAIRAAEKPFYEILGEKYPPSPTDHPLDQNIVHSNCISFSSFDCNNNLADSNWLPDLGGYQSFQYQTYQSSSNCTDYVGGRVLDTPLSMSNVHDFCGEREPAWHYMKGVAEARKFLPSGNNLFINQKTNGLYPEEPKIEVKEEKQDDSDASPNGYRRKKNLHRVDVDFEEGRSNKYSAVFTKEPLRSEMFDMVLLSSREKELHVVSTFQEALRTEASKNGQQNHGKSLGRKKDVVDLSTLLIHCAQAVAADNHRSAGELLKQIRQHSSPFGDGDQRLAHYFANGLEARLAGTGSLIHLSIITKKNSATDILKSCHLFLAACPFMKLSNFFSNNTINTLSENATNLHIIDFGISYGFQWPGFIQRLASRPGGPPKLRITGIDLPQPGFRPAERIEETGLRLASYAEQFKVPFEYHAIAQKWETIQMEDLKINPDEVLVVNCLYRTRNLLDETVVLDSPRNAVLKLIRKMNPTAFIHGVVNGMYNAPFFITRFREALFYHSSIFDVLETNVPRQHPERILLERDLFGCQVLNIIACEGTERTERPETYKQWHVRNMRAGFQLLPLQSECMKKATDRVKSSYHKDFFIDQDNQWMLQGWKGRILYALSAWRPAHSS